MALPPKPRILLFLQGVLMLLAISHGLTFVRYAYDLTYTNVEPPSFWIDMARSIVGTFLLWIAVVGINARKRYGRVLGIVSFSFLAALVVWSAVRYISLLPGISRELSVAVFSTITLVQFCLFVPGALTMAFSKTIGQYFNPKPVIESDPPPPPTFED